VKIKSLPHFCGSLPSLFSILLINQKWCCCLPPVTVDIEELSFLFPGCVSGFSSYKFIYVYAIMNLANGKEVMNCLMLHIFTRRSCIEVVIRIIFE
jgi:hypothetical protein